MKRIILILFLCVPVLVISQTKNDSVSIYKKRVLETIELDVLSSFYTQDGGNAAVTGGIGTEKLNNFATNISVSIPLNDDDVLSVDATVSAYTSASSSNLNPFSSGASGGGEYGGTASTGPVKGSPWVEASGASREDVWINGILSYSHSSDDRNSIYNGNIGIANEFDYSSFGIGGGVTKLFNEKNTEISVKVNLFFDKWRPAYPTEIEEYVHSKGDLDYGFFSGVDILNQQGSITDKNGFYTWKPISSQLVTDDKRNTYSLSLSFSQILTERLQVSIFSDLVMQEGWLSNPMQRVYFSDKDNFYIGIASNILNYTSSTNTGIFQLADDIERLPNTRLKIPVGARAHYYINENITLKTYYRYYFDDWGINSHTASIELPIKIDYGKYTLYPNYRFYKQTSATYFSPYEGHLSTEKYYTSDYDLSEFDSHQYGFGFKYTNVFGNVKAFMFGLKSIDLQYNYYSRSTGLNANIVSLGVKFVED